MSSIWELANWTRQTGNRQFGMLPIIYNSVQNDCHADEIHNKKKVYHTHL